MLIRNRELQAFLDAAETAFCSRALGLSSKESLSQIFRSLETIERQSDVVGNRLPVCRHLAAVSNSDNFDEPDLRLLLKTFAKVEPKLNWFQRKGNCDGASANFADNHANAILVGPTGLEQRDDVWIGVTLVAPNVCYPDHRHAPEETYLVVNAGEFRQEDKNWVHVATGETFYNPYNIMHCMRSGSEPLFVFWALREKSTL